MILHTFRRAAAAAIAIGGAALCFDCPHGQLTAGIPYHGPTLMREVKEMVAKAREERSRTAPASKR
jgi:hypothetical protein